ncbi:nucleoporin ASM4 [Microdochium nivale]|nr:nucleoporin ASM4 [Microdochium nivale]
MVNSPRCTADAAPWVTIILTMLATNVAWWLLELPLLFTHGFRAFCRSVAWQCLRNHACGLAHLCAMREGKNAQEWAYIYYMGPFRHDDRNKKKSESAPAPPAPLATTDNDDADAAAAAADAAAIENWKLTPWQAALHLAADAISLTAAGMSVKEAVDTPAEFWLPKSYNGVYNVFVWIYPTVPVALTGVYVLSCSLLLTPKPTTTAGTTTTTTRIIADSTTRKATWAGLYALLALGALALLVPTQFLSPAGQRSFLPFTIIAYVLMASPLAAISFGCGGLVSALFFVAVALAARMLGVVMGALVDELYFPFCALKSVGFAAAYGGLGVVGAAFAVGARFYFFDTKSVGSRERQQQQQQQQPPPVYMDLWYSMGRLGGRPRQQQQQQQQQQYYQRPQPPTQYYDGRRLSAQQQQPGYHLPQYQHAPHAQPPPSQQPGYGWNVPTPRQWSKPANPEHGWSK